ncbi:CRISPR-associated endonuclease Cas9 [ANME-1 cluster archaeon GoMg1]|nr:CRISPR-associated endonuclease Cas9 [ANME-1 cluster archaeon GoMg1]
MPTTPHKARKVLEEGKAKVVSRTPFVIQLVYPTGEAKQDITLGIEYLLEKWCRKCAYCGKTCVPVEIEHIVPKSRGGSDRVSNLTIMCHECNQQKGNKMAVVFGHPGYKRKRKKQEVKVSGESKREYNIGGEECDSSPSGLKSGVPSHKSDGEEKF